MQRNASLACAIVLGMLSGCSQLSAGPVFVGARVDPVACADGQSGCLLVSGDIDGDGIGFGSCILYAITGPDGARVAVAASGELALVPGESFEWIVRVPSHLHDWMAVCLPTAEG